MLLRIKEVIKEKGLTINEVAERMNISRVGLSQHIKGNPSVEVLSKIADALGVPITDLFTESFKKEIKINCPYCGKPITLKVEK